jgi:hypothetical protein
LETFVRLEQAYAYAPAAGTVTTLKDQDQGVSRPVSRLTKMNRNRSARQPPLNLVDLRIK